MGYCEEKREKLLELACGALDGADRVELEAHLAGCDGCRARLEDERAFVGLLKSEELPEPRAEFMRALAGKVVAAAKAEEAAEAKAPPRRVKPPAFHGKLKLAALAASFLVLAVGLLVMKAERPFQPGAGKSISQVAKDYPLTASHIEATEDAAGYDELAELMLGDGAISATEIKLSREAISGERYELSDYLNNIDEKEAEELLKMLESEENNEPQAAGGAS